MIGKQARNFAKAILPQGLVDQLVQLEIGAQAFRDVRGRHPRECSVCGFRGRFWASGRQPMVFDSRCPGCRSIGRHRQHKLLMDRHPDWIDAAAVLHFAPEPCFGDRFTGRNAATGGSYVRAEYNPRNGETRVDIQHMQFADGSFDTVICHNVLEHVGDDRLAMAEIRRVLRPGGRAVLSVPMVDAWSQTFEDGSVTSEEGRDLLFNQNDHLRLYGRDFYRRLDDAGFAVEPYVAAEPEVSRYGLERGETIFVARPRN